MTVSVLDKENDNSLFEEFDEKDFHISFFSGTGPGGQNRNKVQASARIIHIPSGMVRTAQTRSRKNSVALAMSALLEDLREMSQKQVKGQENWKRKEQVGSGMRGDKRRTYRFQEGLVHDHITGKTLDLRSLMAGNTNQLWI